MVRASWALNGRRVGPGGSGGPGGGWGLWCQSSGQGATELNDVRSGEGLRAPRAPFPLSLGGRGETGRREGGRGRGAQVPTGT